MKYKFTSKLPNQVCRICDRTFDKKWSSGGVGAVCKTCAPQKDKLDLVIEGVIRNITPIERKGDTPTFSFEACIDGTWHKCSHPCGNWAYVDGWLKDHDIFSVPVGWWELMDLYQRYGDTEIIAKPCHKCGNMVEVYKTDTTVKTTTSCPVCGNENTYNFAAQAES